MFEIAGFLFFLVILAAFAAFAGGLLACLTAVVAFRKREFGRAVWTGFVVGICLAGAVVVLMFANWFLNAAYYDREEPYDTFGRAPAGYAHELVRYEDPKDIAVQTAKGGIIAEPQISHTVKLQLAGRYALAEVEQPSYGGPSASSPHRFILLDMETNASSRFADYAAFARAARAAGVTPALEKPDDVYDRYHETPLDRAFGPVCGVIAALVLIAHFFFVFRMPRRP